MKKLPIFLIVFGVITIMAPEIIAYILGAIFIFFGVNALILGGFFKKFSDKHKHKNEHGDSYVQFGEYKIFK